ncbi:unnamed protein product (macronuclear) [Paramecium tetraurelia]|uniref:Kinesin-like protein n=1 Tax=Paramecium tetraurelia TaxID=5888 RepID=A0BTV1_PARTE|nr:uncharacterized protein GSPATT00032200001 [Paramecium tetraurelia]CAK61968.1 unnamed protein product [Paramecium tetraurelia]|eukprot:XP_001429366.1 hypothetical protein (macronuclear) [Paramecium tetraurelia strain d4-2]
MKRKECVKVVVRARPLSSKEIEEGRKRIVDVDTSRKEINIQNIKGDNNEAQRTFVFDEVFDLNSQQEQVYNNTALPIVESVMDGYNGTVFAYGQTGTGKTHTMEGKNDPPHERGITPRTFDHIIKVIEGTPNIQFLVRCSYLELYNEEVRDLLSPNHLTKLELREKPEQGIFVKDLSKIVVKSVAELNEWLKAGRANRKVGETKMNQESSRSHSIFTLTIESSEIGADQQQHIKSGKLNLVDLAGSERQSKTQAVGVRFEEAININLSLTTLGNVITTLVDGKSQHIPYRDSKLTRLLQDSLGGNTKTVMVANIGPADYNFDETMSTLRYANRAKKIQNNPKINEDPKDAMIREFQEQINKLKDELARKAGGVIGPNGQIQKIKEQVIEVEDDEELTELQKKAQKEKADLEQQIMQQRRQSTLQEEEKKQLQLKLKEKQKLEHNLKKEQENMQKKLQELQEQLLHGDKMKEESRQKEKDLLKARMELEERSQQARRQAEELAKKEAMQMEQEQKYNSTKEEIEAKTQKLNNLIQKIKELKSQAQEQTQFRQRQKEELIEDNRESLRQLNLMNLIIEHFIPEDEEKRLKEKLEFSEEQDDWVIKEFEANPLKKPASAFIFRRPICNFSRMAINFGDANPRCRPENILQTDLDLPQRMTEDFSLEPSQKIQEVLNVALNEDEEEQQMIQNEKQANVYIEDPSIINKEAILNPPSNPNKVRLQSALKKNARRPQSGLKK